MRPPILWIAVSFGTGLWAGLSFLGGVGTWSGVAGLPLLLGAAALARRVAPSRAIEA